MFCLNCGKENPDNAKFCQVCGATLQSSPAATTPIQSVTVEYAGFWRRFAAILIDAVILSAATGAFVAATAGAGFFVGFLAPWLYEGFMLSSEWQATVGKRVMSVVVTDTGGRPISFARATGRHFAKYLSMILLAAGYIVAAFTQKKQALHDMIAETLVVTR